MSGVALRIAREEWRALARNKVAVIAAALLLALIVTSTLISIEKKAAIDAARAQYQTEQIERFYSQPDRHPHRMVHYGQFVFRPLSPLAFFDFGVDAYTGNMVFLEGHRQNSANFAEARQSSLLLRFGQLTPAFVLQTLAPLLVIFLAFRAIAGERERGTLRLMLAQGIGGRQLVAGKLLAHGGVAGLILLPALLALGIMAAAAGAPAGQALLLMAGYAAYLMVWTLAALLVSALVQRGRDALLALVALWMVTVVLLPRVLPEVAAARQGLPTRIETDVAIGRELKAIGDSHNPDDPYFNAFRQRVLQRYGVDDVLDLPVQYAGLVGMEGERLTSELFDRHAAEAFAREDRQNAFVRAFGAASPLIAVRQLSMTLAGTDADSHQDFLLQAERYRYDFVQRLNRMQVDHIPNRNPGFDPRIDASHWLEVPAFDYRAPRPLSYAGGRIAAAAAILALWLAGLALLLVMAGRRLGRIAR
ncbi:MAG: ABC transporter permease [Allosphingosinicella sp.]|uniref:ABC transporter permease n=1 Tax=Allosphingosinicella sp. TaxID=2823234 RepID=UPI0039547272